MAQACSCPGALCSAVSNSLDASQQTELSKTATTIAVRGKGILAADESIGTIGKRFDQVGVENNESNRQAYRSLLFNTPNLNKFISGCILCEETLEQKDLDGTLFVEKLNDLTIIPGIKVDMGLQPLLGSAEETMTMGMDSLNDRCTHYYKLGARFAKWRCVLQIGAEYPSYLAIDHNARSLAQYGLICQQNRLVPIIEPEVLTDGPHDIVKCAQVTRQVLGAVFYRMTEIGMYMPGCLLKPNMVLPGSRYRESRPEASLIAALTVQALKDTVPPSIPGIMFLSGGQSEYEASVNLNAINANYAKSCPWTMSFSYGRAMQATVLQTWAGLPANVLNAQNCLLARAKANSEAQLGVFTGKSSAANDHSLHVEKYVY